MAGNVRTGATSSVEYFRRGAGEISVHTNLPTEFRNILHRSRRPLLKLPTNNTGVPAAPPQGAPAPPRRTRPLRAARAHSSSRLWRRQHLLCLSTKVARCLRLCYARRCAPGPPSEEAGHGGSGAGWCSRTAGLRPVGAVGSRTRRGAPRTPSGQLRRPVQAPRRPLRPHPRRGRPIPHTPPL